MIMATLNITKETEILTEIKESEKKAEEIIESAKREQEQILNDAKRNSSKLLVAKKQEIRELQEKKILDFRSNASSVRGERVNEGKKAANQAKANAEKNVSKAVEFVMKKFEEMM
ncbi:MAG: hypothetical protein V1831_04615 [Candidatus Woesearchaeota archaeon]